jgi:starch synthase (maltosyl-transferring)
MIGRIPILDVSPVVDCGRWPARAVVGETLPVRATVFREGHDAVAANVVLRGPRGRKGGWLRMRPLAPGIDRWEAQVTPTATGRWSFLVEAWSDPLSTWRHDAAVKIEAGVDVELMLEEGAQLYQRAADGMPQGGRAAVHKAVSALRDSDRSPLDRLSPALDPHLVAAMDSYPVRDLVTSSETYEIRVERERALFGSWYEFFPRSEGAAPDDQGVLRSGTFRTAMDRLPGVARMGFDVVYLPPIHPIGRTGRKGPNNTLAPGPDDPGVPWAIGSDEGGHDAVHPELGTLEDFDAFVAATRELGMEVALDLALQASPDHPWAREHPEWFKIRADGSIAYAENPPKKYQDIYPMSFDTDPQGLGAEVLRIVRHWMAHGVRIFRVDNPHTKPVQFWEWLLAEVRRIDPDVIFLAEAFTRPAMMHTLGKIGFQQSYTYFTWRNEKAQLEDYLRELSGPAADYMRPNFFVNTPDILPAYLQYGGPPAFKIRAVLAATLSAAWGVYAGYEQFEHLALQPGSEEYLDSEKYQFRPRDWSSQPERTLAPYIAGLNRLRREHRALQRLRNLRFHRTDSAEVMAYSKREGDDAVLVVVNLNPHSTRETMVHLDLPALGHDRGDRFPVHDEVTGATYTWGQSNYVRLDPQVDPAHIFTLAGERS